MYMRCNLEQVSDPTRVHTQGSCHSEVSCFEAALSAGVSEDASAAIARCETPEKKQNKKEPAIHLCFLHLPDSFFFVHRGRKKKRAEAAVLLQKAALSFRSFPAERRRNVAPGRTTPAPSISAAHGRGRHPREWIGPRKARGRCADPRVERDSQA